MKFLYTVAAFLLLSVAFASVLTSVPKSDAEVLQTPRVDDFEDEVMYIFQRFQRFYDSMNFQIRTYRLSHVALVTRIFNEIMEVFGDELDIIRRASVELDKFIEQRIEELGGETDCIRNVMTERDQISVTVTNNIQVCTLTANNTMRRQLSDIFYPIFADIQAQSLTVNLLVMNALAMGNVMQETDDIITFLNDQYEFFSNQWPVGATQLLRWEQERFRVEGEFYIDEMRDCLMDPTTSYIISAAMLEYQAYICT